MTTCRHILVVDDDRRIRDMLQRYLEQEGFRITSVADAAGTHVALEEHAVDLVLLDLVLPDADGLELAQQVRSQADIPIIMLTGRGDMVDRVVGLEVGADDYIAKPFHLREVLARIRSVLRRTEPVRHADRAGQGRAEGGDGPEHVYSFAGWRFDPAGRALTAPDGRAVELTRGEFDLLQAFVQAPQRTLSRDMLMDAAKGRDYEAYDRTIDAQVARLRKKIESEPGNPTMIKSVRGVGYYFAVSVQRL